MCLFQRVSLVVQRYNSVAFKGFQGYFFGTHRIGLVPLQPTLFLTPDFNPRDLYYRGYKNNNKNNNNNNTSVVDASEKC